MIIASYRKVWKNAATGTRGTLLYGEHVFNQPKPRRSLDSESSSRSVYRFQAEQTGTAIWVMFGWLPCWVSLVNVSFHMFPFWTEVSCRSGRPAKRAKRWLKQGWKRWPTGVTSKTVRKSSKFTMERWHDVLPGSLWYFYTATSTEREAPAGVTWRPGLSLISLLVLGWGHQEELEDQRPT